MIIESLTVTDFRVFQGRQHFALSPRQRWNANTPIVLFGGLNGAGKTSILTAVRLALYGRQSLGSSVTLKSYDEYLSKSIHRSKDRVLQSNHASIGLSFEYAHMGLKSNFEVTRSWSLTGKKIKETIEIVKDGSPLKDLSYEQKQGFLNELIPIGVSELFFFDGEKIGELAKDASGTALAKSIKKLLGLDVIERLNNDLGVLIRNKSVGKAASKAKESILALEKQYKATEESANSTENEYRESLPRLLEARKQLEACEREFLANGGAWAVTRDEEIQNQEKLSQERHSVEDDIRELLSGSYPLSLCLSFVNRTMDQLYSERESASSQSANHAVEEALTKLQTSIETALSAPQFKKVVPLIEEVLSAQPITNSVTEIHNIGTRALDNIQSLVNDAELGSKAKVKELKARLEGLCLEIDEIGERITRAPDEGTLQSTLAEIEAKRQIVEELGVKSGILREEAKRQIRIAIDLARKLDTLYAEQSKDSESSQVEELAHRAQNTLDSFARNAAVQKISKLEDEFSACFQQLARKDDVAISASIDHETFRVSLRDGDGIAVEKDSLSAGEKQIYAIAMLEALARTSGRKLPIIIDTPLGRLDSKHRQNLVQNYFPRASHQVIILSTDTEVDESFYGDLYKHMSHAFKLEYSSSSGSTSVEEGYFWRSKKEPKVA